MSSGFLPARSTINAATPDITNCTTIYIVNVSHERIASLIRVELERNLKEKQSNDEIVCSRKQIFSSQTK